MLRRVSTRPALLAAVLGSLLVLAGLVSTGSGAARAGGVPGPPAVSKGAAAAVVSLSSAAPGLAVVGPPTTRRPVIKPGSGLAAFAAVRAARPVERDGSVEDRASPGPADHLAIGPAAGALAVLPPDPATREAATATAPGAPLTALGARAPPVR